MKLTAVLVFLVLPVMVMAQNTGTKGVQTEEDWLVRTPAKQAGFMLTASGDELQISNGLVSRSFRLEPNLVCMDYRNLINGQQLLRALSPEARLTINGKSYDVGGLHGQKEKAYLQTRWLNEFTSGENDFQYIKYETGDIQPYIHWDPGDWWAMNRKQPEGLRVTFYFKSLLKELEGLNVSIIYELYNGLPLIAKWLELHNISNNVFKLDRVTNEILALVEEESAVVGRPEQMKTQQGLYIETNYAFNNAMRYNISDQTTHWKTDTTYTSQVNYNYQTPCILEVYPDKAPGVELQPGEKITSIRTYELLQDSYDRERRGLAIRKMYRTIAPWTTMNPIFMHLVSRNDEEVRNAIDQCAATGYEAVILSFGSHLNMEDTSSQNIGRWKNLAGYAHQRGIRIGGYSLFSSRRISDEDDVINPVTGKPGGAFFGNAPCFGSRWGLAYRDKIKNFFAETGFDIWENDGPYPGDVCASTSHPGHKNLDDSQWRQMEIQKGLYRWLNEHGIYINAPDWYFLDGTHKIAIGYREVNFSLSREQQKILNRQNIFDGTWEKTPSMGWGFVPLTRYHGGGPEAILEPLHEHLEDYRQLMMQYYGAGVQACYRGPRLFDTEETKQTVISVINWYKQNRDILNSDIIHLRRADGRDWDGWMHINPGLDKKALVMLFNPLREKITRTVQLPLYYTGLTDTATVFTEKGNSFLARLNRKYEIELSVTLEPETYSWFLIQ